jgi:uncharacterized membrane protein
VTSAAPTTRARLDSVDVVRGVIMIIMALDHTRDFFGMPGANPTDMASTTTALFFTRWITHFCAPTFFLLTGTGAFLSRRKHTTRSLSRFLLTRGVWLLFLDVVVLRCFALQFNFDYQVTIVNVLWALGWSMIALSGLVYLPVRAVTGIGLAMIVGHNLLDPVKSSSALWTILHSPGFLLQGAHTVFIAYPLIPWIGVTAVGYGLGALYRWPDERRRRWLVRLGLGATCAFVVLRAINVYGDPSHWAPQRSPLFTALSFLNTTKYPPSLLFLLMTLGPVLLFLRAIDGGTPRFLRPAITYGRVPLMYFMVHMALIHVVAVAVSFARYGAVHWMFESPSMDKYPITPPPGWGFSLPVIYLIWAAVVISLYPLCRWFAALKQRRSDTWLSYL